MKAWRFYDFGDMRLDEVPDPEPRPGWAVCRIRRVQASIIDVQRAYGVGTTNSHLLRETLRKHAPVQLLGHELSGEITAVGEGVEGLRVGDIVCTTAHIPCGRCSFCREGREGWCPDKLHVGINLPGAFAEMLALPAAGFVKVPAGLDDASVACLQSLSSAVACLRDANLRPGEKVAVTGQGCMGLYVMQAARACGVGAVYTTDVKDEALDLSRRLGAEEAIDARRADPVERVRALTGGRGVDVAFDCAGGKPDHGLSGHETLHQAMRMLRHGGRLVEVSGLSGEVRLDPVFLRSRGIKWIFPEGQNRETLALGARWVASGRIDVRSLITHEVHGLEKLPEAMEITRHKDDYRATNPCQVVLV